MRLERLTGGLVGIKIHAEEALGFKDHY
jgi:hypothetical protein